MTRAKGKNQHQRALAAEHRFEYNARSAAFSRAIDQRQLDFEGRDNDDGGELAGFSRIKISRSRNERSSSPPDEPDAKRIKREAEDGNRGSLPLFLAPDFSDGIIRRASNSSVTGDMIKRETGSSKENENKLDIAAASQLNSVLDTPSNHLDLRRFRTDREQRDITAGTGGDADADEDTYMDDPAIHSVIKLIESKKHKISKQAAKLPFSFSPEDSILSRPRQNHGQNCPPSQEQNYIKQEKFYVKQEKDEGIIHVLLKRNIIILYGYTWGDRIVNTPFIQEILNRCNPREIDLSTEVSDHEKYVLQAGYGVDTDFVKLEFGTVEEKNAAIEGLQEIKLPSCYPGSTMKICEYPGLSTQPQVLLQNQEDLSILEEGEIADDEPSPNHSPDYKHHTRTRTNSVSTRSASMSIPKTSSNFQPLIREDYDTMPSPSRKEPRRYTPRTSTHLKNSTPREYLRPALGLYSPPRGTKTAPITSTTNTTTNPAKPKTQTKIKESTIEDRKGYLPHWLALANAVAEARTKLQGEDLEVFEAMIAKPTPDGNDAMRVLGAWVARKH